MYVLDIMLVELVLTFSLFLHDITHAKKRHVPVTWIYVHDWDIQASAILIVWENSFSLQWLKARINRCILNIQHATNPTNLRLKHHHNLPRHR